VDIVHDQGRYDDQGRFVFGRGNKEVPIFRFQFRGSLFQGAEWSATQLVVIRAFGTALAVFGMAQKADQRRRNPVWFDEMRAEKPKMMELVTVGAWTSRRKTSEEHKLRTEFENIRTFMFRHESSAHACIKVAGVFSVFPYSRQLRQQDTPSAQEADERCAFKRQSGPVEWAVVDTIADGMRDKLVGEHAQKRGLSIKEREDLLPNPRNMIKQKAEASSIDKVHMGDCFPLAHVGCVLHCNELPHPHPRALTLVVCFLQ
jgi:hypothetical protein